MLIVGGALALTAISVFILWRFILTWRARKAKGKRVAEHIWGRFAPGSLKADPERNPFRKDHGLDDVRFGSKADVRPTARANSSGMVLDSNLPDCLLISSTARATASGSAATRTRLSPRYVRADFAKRRHLAEHIVGPRCARCRVTTFIALSLLPWRAGVAQTTTPVKHYTITAYLCL